MSLTCVCNKHLYNIARKSSLYHVSKARYSEDKKDDKSDVTINKKEEKDDKGKVAINKTDDKGDIYEDENLASKYIRKNFNHIDGMTEMLKGIKEDAKYLAKDPFIMRRPIPIPRHTDFLIVGGGAMGSAIAYFIKEACRSPVEVVVVEKDFTYKSSSSALSVGGIRQQFSLKENVLMSLFGARFLRDAKTKLEVNGFGPPHISFSPFGYLTLATAEGANTLQANHYKQNALGARNELLTPFQMNRRFPWLNTKGIELGCHGLQYEGWFDAYSLVTAFKARAINCGARFIEGEVVKFIPKHNPRNDEHPGYGPGEYMAVHDAEILLPNGKLRNIEFARCIIAAGANTGKIFRDLLDVKHGNKGPKGFEVPIEPKKRYVYCFDAPSGPPLASPMVIDPSGVYVRREGLTNTYICGRSPDVDKEPPVDDLSVDEKFFEEDIWPIMANRIPDFEKLKMRSSWAGFYDYNTFDQNAIIGLHPAYDNIFMASGFSGHGIQMAAAIGRAMLEILLYGNFTTIDLKRFSFDRIITQEPLIEEEII